MAERTLVELRDNAGAPSWAVGVEVESYVKFIASHGPYKTETLLFQQAAANDFKADDTFKSRLAHPLWVTVVSTSDLDDNQDGKISAEVDSLESSSLFKTISLRNADDRDGEGVQITVYGF